MNAPRAQSAGCDKSPVAPAGIHPIVRLFCQRNNIPLDQESVPQLNAEVLAILAADDGSDHIQSRSALSAAGAGASNVSPANSPAASDDQGSGPLFSVNHHEADNG